MKSRLEGYGRGKFMSNKDDSKDVEPASGLDKLKAESAKKKYPSSTDSLRRSIEEQQNTREKHHSRVLDLDKDFQDALAEFRKESEGSKSRLQALKRKKEQKD